VYGGTKKGRDGLYFAEEYVLVRMDKTYISLGSYKVVAIIQSD
jgi:hypothetical protein